MVVICLPFSNSLVLAKGSMFWRLVHTCGVAAQAKVDWGGFLPMEGFMACMVTMLVVLQPV